jgi:hypothetical protein|tara:strand:- start:4926 stop:5300 length:375 start_codon:yes stop_codon:yes gene_type:complete
MSGMNAKDALEVMATMYQSHFGGGKMPYGGKDYPILSAIAKQRGGFEEVVADFEFMLSCDEGWLQGKKSLGYYMKFYPSIGCLRDTYQKEKTAVLSYSELQKVQAEKERLRREQYRKELFDDEY